MTLVKEKIKRHTVAYECQLTKEGVVIDEIVNGKPNRVFRIKCSEDEIQEFWQSHHETDRIFDLKNEPDMIHDYAMLNEIKWEEVAP